MKKKKVEAENLFSTVSIVPVNEGRLLEDNLKKWQGGSQHIRGIAISILMHLKSVNLFLSMIFGLQHQQSKMV